LGPYGALTLFRPSDITTLLGELGLIMLLFYMGLEFSLRRFVEGGRATLYAGAVDLLNLLAGVSVGLLLGLGWLAALFLGGIVYISSSGVIAKLLVERNLVAYPEAERTLGVLVFEDLAMIFVLGGLSLLTAEGGLMTLAGAALFLLLYALLLRFGQRPLERLLSREGEPLVLLTLALVVLFAFGAKSVGFPEAVAAFLLGMVVGELELKTLIEETLAPWRDVAAAAFFFDFGLHVDLGSALQTLPAALLLVLVTLVVQAITGFSAGRLTGLSRRASVGHALMLIPRGEFSLVVVGLAAGVDALAPDTRAALTGMTSLYVLVMVVLGSVVFNAYDAINGRLTALLRTRAERERDAARQRELDSVTLD